MMKNEIVQKKPYVSVDVVIYSLESRDIVTFSDSLANKDIVNDDIFG